MRFLTCLAFSLCISTAHADDNPIKPIPTLYLIGDSTVKNGTKGQQGWGDPFANLFDSTKLAVENRARGGRSSRTFLTEGLWGQVESKLIPGDFVIIQFGHNDGGALTDPRARASIKGNGDETQEVTDPKTDQPETVHSYGWYLRQYIAGAKAKGAKAIVVSPVPRNMWQGGKVNRAARDYGKWAAEAADQGGALFLDLNQSVAACYEKAGPEVVKAQYFGTDHTHTTVVGASMTAAVMADALRGRTDCSIADGLKTSLSPPAEKPHPTVKFDFGPGKVEPGSIQILPTTAYTKELGYGFEPGAQVRGIDRGGQNGPRSAFCTSPQPFLFSVNLPEGNYDVSVTLGDKSEGSTTSIKAESRRLMLEQLKTAPGEFLTRTFTVNVRKPEIAKGVEVKLNKREIGTYDWDDKLTLEFNDARPCIRSIEIRPNALASTVYLVGDSTVTDQASEPWNSWGQMLPRFFRSGVAVANHAESGEALRRFASERRLDKILSQIRPGDYLFIQFGHNDQKERGEGVGAFTTYQESLKDYVAEARRSGAIPVLVTPVNRRTFNTEGMITNSLGDFPEAVRRVAKKENVSLIDLNAMSKLFYEALGPDGSKQAFVDNTHHNTYGSYEIARCVIEGIKESNLGLVRFLREDQTKFDPSHPDPVGTFNLPASPQKTAIVPEGSE